MKLLLLFACATLLMALAIAQDIRCDDKENGDLCVCGRGEMGQCVDGVCECDNLIRSKRGICSSSWDCGSRCNCLNRRCCCPWHRWC